MKHAFTEEACALLQAYSDRTPASAELYDDNVQAVAKASVEITVSPGMLHFQGGHCQPGETGCAGELQRRRLSLVRLKGRMQRHHLPADAALQARGFTPVCRLLILQTSKVFQAARRVSNVQDIDGIDGASPA